MRYAIIIFLFIFLIKMPLQNWEGLQKSVTDDETIEQAIARLIAVHESDSESHLGVGESLAAHKAADVIDHPAGSIVADKFSNQAPFIDFNIIPLIPGNLNRNSGYNAAPMLFLEDVSPSSGDLVYTWFDINPPDWGYTGGDIIFDFSFYQQLGNSTTQTTFLVGNWKVEYKNEQYRAGYYNGSWHYSDWINESSNHPLRFRFWYHSDTNILSLYLIDKEVWSVSYTIDIEDVELYTQCILNRGTYADARARFGNARIWVEGI